MFGNVLLVDKYICFVVGKIFFSQELLVGQNAYFLTTKRLFSYDFPIKISTMADKCIYKQLG